MFGLAGAEFEFVSQLDFDFGGADDGADDEDVPLADAVPSEEEALDIFTEEIDQLLESALSGGEKPEWANEDSLRSPKELSDSLKAAGVESCNLICAIDFTASNKTAGAASFGGHSLHALGVRGGNPYEQALSIIGKTLSTMDEDNLIPAFGFGDQT
mgnify:CR=1 FL=1